MLFLKQNLHKEEAKKQVEVCGGRGDCHSKGHSEKTCCVRVKKNNEFKSKLCSACL